MGFTLEQLQLQTTDEKFNPAFLDRTSAASKT
jgi:hypothetical protein